MTNYSRYGLGTVRLKKTGQGINKTYNTRPDKTGEQDRWIQVQKILRSYCAVSTRDSKVYFLEGGVPGVGKAC